MTDHLQRTLRVLIVDDHADNLNTMAILVRMWGHAAKTACCGADALALYPDFLPDVMILDISMPDMNGNELARRIRQLPDGANVLLIAITGHGYERDVQLSKDAGFEHHLLKPAEPAVVEGLLAAARDRLGDSVLRVTSSPQSHETTSCSSAITH